MYMHAVHPSGQNNSRLLWLTAQSLNLILTTDTRTHWRSLVLDELCLKCIRRNTLNRTQASTPTCVYMQIVHVLVFCAKSGNVWRCTLVCWGSVPLPAHTHLHTNIYMYIPACLQRTNPNLSSSLAVNLWLECQDQPPGWFPFQTWPTVTRQQWERNHTGLTGASYNNQICTTYAVVINQQYVKEHYVL